MLKKMFVFLLVTFSLGGILTQSSYGAGYPTKPIELVCPYTPGSSMDVLSRLIADTAPKYLGQPVVVLNKPGAGASIAAADVVTSKADGYKILTNTNTFFGTTVKTQKVPFNPNDLTPVANFMEYKMGLLVKGDAPWKNLKEFLDYGKKNPGKIRWGHTGRGIANHMSALLIFKRAGVQTIDIPNRGSPENLSALLGGHLDAACIAYGTVQDQVKTGAIRYLVMFSEQRYSGLTDVPSATELGFADAGKLITLIGVYVHKNTPEEAKKVLFEALKKTYNNPEFKKGLENLGEEPRFGDAEYMKESIRNIEAVGVPILKELGLYVGQ